MHGHIIQTDRQTNLAQKQQKFNAFASLRDIGFVG